MISKFVVDTSIIVKWLNKNNENFVYKAEQLMEDAINGDIEIFAPELAKYELCSVLLKSKKLLPKDMHVLLTTLYNLPITFVIESQELAQETYDVAFKLGITYYDATFISLALQYDAFLITENMKHQGKSSLVKSIEDY